MMLPRVVPDEGSPSLLNPKYDEDYRFPQFALLPWELRNQVWGFALRKRRLLRLCITERHPEGLEEHESRSIRYGRCSLLADGYQAFSKLLSVNSEARKAALEFYRVQLPCVLNSCYEEGKNKGGRVGKLPFNPEYDILWFNQKFEDLHHLSDFLSAIGEHDSRQVGLCNLAIPVINSPMAATLGFSDPPPTYLDSGFRRTAQNIREFYLVSETNSYHLANVKDHYNQSGQPHCGAAQITQSLSPLMADIPSFDVLRRDPRPIASDLFRAFLGFDHLMSETHYWTIYLAGWGVDESRLESRVLFVYRDSNPSLPPEAPSYEGPSVQRSRIPNMDRVLYEPASSSAPSINLTTEKQPSKAGDCLAVGFWLFPFRAFTQKNIIQPEAAQIWNLSNYWPELGLFHLPTGPSST